MNRYRSLLLALTLLLLGACQSHPELGGEETAEGLRPLLHTNMDEVYIRPDIDLAAYDTLYVAPPTVTYSERRHRDSLGRGEEAFRFNDGELKKFQATFIEAFEKQLGQALQLKPVNEPRSDSLTVRPVVVDLYLYASIRNDEVYPTSTYARETAEMTLQLEVLAGDTNRLLLRAEDERRTGERGEGPGSMRRVSAPTFWSDVGIQFRQWANLVGSYLEQQAD